MQSLSQSLSKNLPLLIILTAAVTFFSPVYLKTPSWVPGGLLGVVMFFTGLSMNIDAIKAVRYKKKELFVASSFKWLFTAGISILLALLLFRSHQSIAAGLILTGSVPSATAASLYTFLAGGNTSLVISASLLDIIISPLATPLAMNTFSGTAVAVSFLDLLKSFLFIVILPISAGIAFQKLFPRMSSASPSITRVGSSFSLILIIHTLVGTGTKALKSEIELLPLVVFAVVIQVLLPMLIAYLTAKKLNIHEKDARAILFQAGLCNSALAAILSFEYFGELAAVPAIINMITNLSAGALISNYFSKKDASYSASLSETL
ncbi:bile acid:sodium symporter family protein [Bacillus sp. MMSF_3328]|uniref:bile acid:sodium symporter family protein n=1 Tax=Bacillus sp. MMSF_3328 TaxID=3047080 RepID=UPI00273EA00F|nr:bile acid:sodium symporter [Bacillus sp. MMSF_3328]